MNTYQIKYGMARLQAALAGLGKPLERAVLFSSYHGKQYSDNPRTVSERLAELAPDVKQYWWAQDEKTAAQLPAYVTPVRGGVKDMRKTLLKVSCFVSNEYNRVTTPKRRGQFFVQTWHGDRGFKRVLLQYKSDGGKIIGDALLTDLCVAGSDYGVKRYREAFGYEGEILRAGMPRNDCLVRCTPEDTRAMKKRLGLDEDQHILLYAPTFRGNHSARQATEVDLERVLGVLSEGGDRWMCMMRAHSGVEGFEKIGERCVDMTDYPDIMDLMVASDMLFTDYSSCAGDFLLLHRPVVLTVFDQEEYTSQSRKLNMPLEDTGYLLAHDQEELERILREHTAEDYAANCDRVLAYYGTFETGRATEEVCRRILDAMERKERTV